MVFTDFKTLQDVKLRFQISERRAELVEPRPHSVSAALREWMAMTSGSAHPWTKAARRQRLVWLGWHFERLTVRVVTREPKLCSRGELDRLCGALRFVLERCREQAQATAKLAA